MLITLTIILLFTQLSIIICNKFDFLINSNGSIHQKFTASDNVPLIGGLIIFLFLLVEINFFNFKVFIFFIFLIGFLSDIKKFNSPKLRLFTQSLLILLFTYHYEVYLDSTNIIILDYFLKYNYFSIIFTSFCIVIIINGSNFMDGINTLVVGYYLILSGGLYYLSYNGYLVNFNLKLEILVLMLLCLFVFNFFNKLYLGDSGSYLLGFIFSVGLIKFYIQNINISPFFIILLLWYPAFENLFSIIRKASFNRSPINPDTNHLHQLIYYYYFKKNFFSTKLLNTTVGVVINLYNLIIFSISLQNIEHSQLQLLLIFFNISLYVIIYRKLLAFKLGNKHYD